ncbi:serine protease inhibitor 3/4-like isoform X2 [Leguminivora glycinivorella]|uniref:serine protease inhibitor 3/4-like isoform X2 n=1 Tax=Leguminivora glycinivorella TaxID=1035111 RepID=UPI0020103270|nr:serine protease inhibitor 3/4-like isoform X2 [Leguminivora glycinivorella]
MTTSSEHVANFGARFCNELQKDKSFICSPLSVETVVALVARGSSNESRAEIFKALDILNEDDLFSTFISITKTLASTTNPSKFRTCEDVTLKIVNKIYIKKGAALKPALKKDAEEVFNASLEQVDFRHGNCTANAINTWVANQTNNTIKDIVSAEMFDDNTQLVLINAIYFYAFWEHQFNAEDTYPRVFHVNNSKKINIKQMSLMGKPFNYKHSEELKAKILQMFYIGGEASMVIVLPDEIEGLSDLMKNMASGHDLMAEIKSLKKKDLQVIIPKFKVESHINLKELLPKMGINLIFDQNKSEINMLSSDDRLFVSEAIQKAFIAVDELGTEAAAATQIMWRNMCGRHWTGETFAADHPFLYLLTVTALQIPVFYGTYNGTAN